MSFFSKNGNNKKTNKKDNSNSNLENMNSIKLLSLAPNYEIDNLNEYDFIIDNCLSEKRLVSTKSRSDELKELKNRNIAITGDYGCGKSSVINSFFARHENYNFISVSMGLYRTIKDDNKDIYKYILKQILYTERPFRLPFSNYKRNDKSGIYFYISNVLIAVSVVIFLLLFLKKLNFDSIWILIITGLFVIFDIMYILQKLNIKGLSLGLPLLPGSVEFTNGSNNELLNENIEELIHFFLSTKYSIVVFEDLDREESYPELIKTLSMINYTINNSIKGKTIQFIYSVSDRCFENSEERTKSFDSIIPIKPFVNDFNSINRLDKLLSQNAVNSFGNYIECLKVSCKYLTNPRLIFDFVNEFSIYYNENLPDKSKEELFYLILYKISFPKKFYEFIKKESTLAKYFSGEFEEYVEKEKNMEFSLIPISQKIESLESYRKSKFIKLKELDSFEKMLINRNVITRNYDRLFVNRDPKLDKISIDDEIILDKIRNDEDISKAKFSSLETVFQELDITDFQRDSIINFDLLNYAESNNEKYIQQFIDSITEKKLKFIVNNEEELFIIKKFKNQISKLWVITLNMDKKDPLTKSTCNKLLFYIFKYCDIDYIQSFDSSIIQYLQSTNSYLKLFDERYEEIKETYQKIEYKFDENIKISKSYSNILKDIFITDKIPLSYENIETICDGFKIELKSSKIITNIKNVKDLEIRNKLIESINIIIDLYISNIKVITIENDNDLAFLLSDTNISMQNINKVIDKLSKKIELLDIFENYQECYEYIISSSKYEITNNNLESIYSKNKEFLITYKAYIIENGQSIINKGLNKSILDYIINNVLINMNYNQLIIYLDLFKKNDMREYIRIILTNNLDSITLKNYSNLLCYDANLVHIFTTGQIVNKDYEAIIVRLKLIGLVSSYDLRENHFIVRVKREFKLKKIT